MTQTSSSPSDDVVLYDVTDRIATLTLNRPERGNVYNWDLADAMNAALERADADDEVRVVIVTGAGKYFCVGMDLDAFGDLGNETSETIGGWTRDGGGTTSLKILGMRKPVIMAMNGSAAGIGVTMTLGADIRIAAEGAKYAMPFTRRAISPEGCSTWLLPRIVGITQALEWVITGRTLTAEEAKAGGLFSYVVPADQVVAKAREIATDIVANTSPISVAASRQMMWRALGFDSPWDGHRQESEAIIRLVGGPDGAEGAAAFREKRPVQFPSTLADDYTFEWDRWPETPGDIEAK